MPSLLTSKKKKRPSGQTEQKTCLACGMVLADRRKKYCSSDCCEDLAAQLERWSGLLVGLEARYVNFWFTDALLILDVLKQNAREVLRFVYERTPGRKPFEDYFDMANELGTHWWDAMKKTRTRFRATEHVFARAVRAGIPPEVLRPKAHKRSRVSQKHLACLKLSVSDLLSDSAYQNIKSAYRRAALRHHPDTGGSSRSFIEVQKAYEELRKLVARGKTNSLGDLLTSSRYRAAPGKWCFDGRARRWYRPARR